MNAGSDDVKRHHMGANSAFAVATSVLGFVVGWLTGSSGPHPQVVAAVVPVVVTASGLALYLTAQNKPFDLSRLGAAICIVLFCGMIFVGLYLSINAREDSIRHNIYSEADMFRLIELKNLYSVKCSELEYEINDLRTQLGLSKLNSDYFCRPDNVTELNIFD